MELRSARLEIELLRRHLQPHFLMNTLTALSEWFEQEPDVATEMIQDLGRELRILGDISSRSSITIAQELELCRSHLAVMARRRDEQLELSAEGVDPEACIPPAIFHTLLENALTHNSYRDRPACFRLRQSNFEGRVRYVFEAPYHPRGQEAVTRAPRRHGLALRPGTPARELRRRLSPSSRSRARRHGVVHLASPAGDPMRVLMVEDEAVPARRLERLIRELLGTDLEHLESLSHVDDAIDRILESPVDLVFLDLNLHGQDGFDLLRRAVSGAFHTIVVSAHTERALEAFELGVLDFVPKPFTRDRLRSAIERAAGSGPDPRALKYLAVRRSGNIQLVPIDDVVFVRAADDYAELHTGDGQVHLHDKTLSKLATLLPEPFERVHRSYLVDLRQARHLKSEPGSRYFLELKDGRQIPVGRTRVRALRRRFI